MKEDDPRFLTAMLEYVYGRRNPSPTADEAPNIGYALFCVGVYRVADKYVVPALESWASERFKIHMRRWLKHPDDHGAERADLDRQHSFCDVVIEIY